MVLEPCLPKGEVFEGKEGKHESKGDGGGAGRASDESMDGRALHLSAQPFGATFQLNGSPTALSSTFQLNLPPTAFSSTFQLNLPTTDFSSTFQLNLPTFSSTYC